MPPMLILLASQLAHLHLLPPLLAIVAVIPDHICHCHAELSISLLHHAHTCGVALNSQCVCLYMVTMCVPHASIRVLHSSTPTHV